MLEHIKKLFRNYWVLSVFCIVLGVALIAKPDFFTNAIGYVVGGMLAAYGVVELVRYFLKSREDPLYATGLVAGVVLCVSGIFIMAKPDFIPKIIALTFGLYMIISGIVNLQDSLNIKSAVEDKWKFSTISAIITILIGIALVVNPLLPTYAALTILGISLLISGISNITGCFSAGRVLKNIRPTTGELVRAQKKEEFDDYIDMN